jgi:hypothetical protein
LRKSVKQDILVDVIDQNKWVLRRNAARRPERSVVGPRSRNDGVAGWRISTSLARIHVEQVDIRFIEAPQFRVAYRVRFPILDLVEDSSSKFSLNWLAYEYSVAKMWSKQDEG